VKAFIIARVSTDDQIDALPAQIYKLKDYAERNNFDYELIQIQESAYSGKRELIKSIIERIEKHPEELAVVFDKIDRYTRDTSSEVVRTMTNLYKSGKITLHFPSDGLILHKSSSANDELRLGLGIVTSKYYSDAVSDNVIRRFDQMRRDGLWTGKAPLGYRNIDKSDGKKWIVKDPIKSYAIKDIYELYATGTQSLKTVRLRIIEKHNIKLAVSQIDTILKNPFLSWCYEI